MGECLAGLSLMVASLVGWASSCSELGHGALLLAQSNPWVDWANTIWFYMMAALGLGFVIFVHELGHFAVAKMCGVKCEKFYLGFDIGGLKLAKFQWGETEYGIGILPLGGYVKMLGQDDNPARAAEERERSLQKVEGAEGDAAAKAVANPPLDPRSYMAKSVPQRMAIISAGVIMNVIFAVLMATLAFGLGVPEIPCVVGSLLPGEAAWQANIQPGDRILQINEMQGTPERPLRFDDLRASVALGDAEKGVRFLIERPGKPEPFWVNIKPDMSKIKSRLMPSIGVANAFTTRLRDNRPVMSNTPAAEVKKFRGGDVIVAVDGQPVADATELEGFFARNADKTLTITVERKTDGATTREEIEVPPRPRRWMGLAMRLGKVVAVQADSPAAKAGLEQDDFLVEIDDKPPGDINTMALPELFRSKAGETVTLKVQRKGPAGQDAPVEIEVVPRNPPWYEEARMLEAPLSIPALGLALRVQNIIQSVEAGGPAENAPLMKGDQPAKPDRLAPGEEIVKAELIGASREKQLEEENLGGMVIEFQDKEGNAKSNWPALIDRIQYSLPDTKVKLTLRDGRTVEILPANSPTEFNPDRGFMFMPEEMVFRATSVGEAFELGLRETKKSLLQVYSFLRRIGTQVSAYALGGPGTIIQAAGGAASQGLPKLLLFLTMLSANLAVINFLPIPVLDGGHMVFLILEGIFRRPVDERIVAVCQWAGLLLIVGLMLFVISLDLGIISRV